MPGSLKGERESLNADVHKITICIQDVQNTTISVLMVPLEQNNEKKYPSYTVTSLDEW